MSRTWILTALGKDQPGIVAAVTKILFECGANLEDSSMARLAGEFTMMVNFSLPAARTTEELERAFAPLRRRRLVVHVKALLPGEQRVTRVGAPYMISVYGADKPGIVYRVTSVLAKYGVNITGVSTHRTMPNASGRLSLYSMILEAELPPTLKPTVLARKFRAMARSLKVEISFHAADATIL